VDRIVPTGTREVFSTARILSGRIRAAAGTLHTTIGRVYSFPSVVGVFDLASGKRLALLRDLNLVAILGNHN
jgi:hypothetical protein